MIDAKGKLTVNPVRKTLQELADLGRFDEVASVLNEERKKSKSELWQLVFKSRVIQLGDSELFTLDDAALALEEAIERDSEYVPALLEMAHFLDVNEGKADMSIELFRQATDLILEQLLDALRGWGEAKLLDDEFRRNLLLAYNRFLGDIHSRGLAAGTAAKRIHWFDPEEHGEEPDESDLVDPSPRSAGSS